MTAFVPLPTNCNLPPFRFPRPRQLSTVFRLNFSYSSALVEFLIHRSEARSLVNAISSQHVYKEGLSVFLHATNV